MTSSNFSTTQMLQDINTLTQQRKKRLMSDRSCTGKFQLQSQISGIDAIQEISEPPTYNPGARVKTNMFKSDYMDDSFFKAVTSLYDSPKGNSDRANSHIGNSRYLKKQILTDSQRFRATTANFFKDKPYAKPKLILISDYELDPLQFETQATSKKESRKLSKKDYTIEQSIQKTKDKENVFSLKLQNSLSKSSRPFFQKQQRIFQRIKDRTFIGCQTVQETFTARPRLNKIKSLRENEFQKSDCKELSIFSPRKNHKFSSKNFVDNIIEANKSNNNRQIRSDRKWGDITKLEEPSTNIFREDKEKQQSKERKIVNEFDKAIVTQETKQLQAIKEKYSDKAEGDQSTGEPLWTINDFLLSPCKGEGRFGKVFMAIHKKSGFLLAIKQITKDSIRLMKQQFSQQMKVQLFLDSPNIVKTYGHFHDHENIYIIMEYMQEGSLYKYIKKEKRLTETDAKSKLKEICTAIKALHTVAILHRDIKPENIVISNGVCKLCDFGWAVHSRERRRTYCGTLDYVCPEILEGESYGQQVDIWAVGVMAYQMLIGKAPFYHISQKQTKKNIVNCQLKFPVQLSLKAKKFILKTLQKVPGERCTIDSLLKDQFLIEI